MFIVAMCIKIVTKVTSLPFNYIAKIPKPE